MFIKLKKVTFSAFIITIALFSCGKKTTPNPAGIKKTTVYISGNHITGGGIPVATYWKNGVEIALADSSISSTATAITVSDTDVYIAGTLNYVATYWKNGKAVSLPGAAGYPNAIAVSGKDVYVAGRGNIGYAIQPVYWKNGVPVAVGDTKNIYNADAIAVVGNDVYVAGDKADTIVLLKNGVPVNIASSPSSFATFYANTYYQGWVNMAVNGSDVYITGATPTHLAATYWKNGVANTLVTDPTVSSVLNNIAIYGNDVYTAGFYSFSAAYWKNGVLNKLPAGSQPSYMATAIAVSGSDIYVAGTGGYPDSVPVYWKNGILVQLSTGRAVTTGIALVQQ